MITNTGTITQTNLTAAVSAGPEAGNGTIW